MSDDIIHAKIKKKNITFAFVLGAVTLILAVARIFLVKNHVHPFQHHYTDPAGNFIYSFDYVVAAVVLIVIIFSLFFYKSKDSDGNKYRESAESFVQGTHTQIFTSALAGCFLAFAPLYEVYLYFTEIYADGADIIEAIKLYITGQTFDFIAFILSFIAAIYFFRTAWMNTHAEPSGESESSEEESEPAAKKPVPQIHVILSLVPTVWAMVNTFKCFFDMSNSINSPVRIFELLSFLALSAYFVAESRMLLGRLETARFFTYSYITLIIVTLSALPNLLLSSFGELIPIYPQITYAAELAFVLYIGSRVYSQLRYGKYKYTKI